MRSVLLLTLAALAAAPTAHADPLGDAITGDQRSEANRARDEWRHPRATLEFFGFSPDQTVVELWPGGGWYTEILAPALKERGTLIVAGVGEGEAGSYRSRSHKAFLDKLAASPEVYGAVRMTEFWPPEETTLGTPGSADLVVTFRNTHSMYRRDQLEAFFAAAHEVLKSGGTLGIVQHRAAPGTDPETARKTGYVPESFVVELAEAAGFRLDARSEINANPQDTRDHPDGVWSLPPGLRSGEADRDKYIAIGESDRMTLRFTRP